MNKDRKIYVIGSSTGYARWMGGKITNNMEEADLVVLTGGADIQPKLYRHPESRTTHAIPYRDEYEIEEYNKAKSLGKKIIGICRGMQLMTALNGGWLIQDMNHRGGHTITFFDGTKGVVNSLHHQMCVPFDIPEARVLGWCDPGTSSYYVNGNDEYVDMINMYPEFVEPEIILFNKNELGYQYHP